MIVWTIFIVLIIHQLYGFDEPSACTVSRHLMATLRGFSPLISPDASLVRPPKNPQQFVRGFCDFRRVSNKYNSTCIGRSRPHGVHVAEDQHNTSAGEGWHNISRRRFHPKPRSHGPWSGISRVSKALFTSNGMDMILTLSAFNDRWLQKKKQNTSVLLWTDTPKLVIWNHFCNCTNWMKSGIKCNVSIFYLYVC